MRVAISGTFWPALTTGSGQHLQGLLPALLAADNTISYRLYLPYFNLTKNECISTLVENRIVKTPFDHLNRNLAKVWYEQVALPGAVRRDGADVLHIPYLGAPLHSGIPVVVTVHDLIPLILKEYRAAHSVRLYTKLACRAAQRADQVIAVSGSAAQDVQRLLRISGDKIHVIYNALPGGYEPPSTTDFQSAAARLGLPERYLVYLGGFDRRKQVPELLEAFSAIQGQIPGIQLVVAGRLPKQDNAFTPDPQRIVRELGLGSRVQFLGEVSETDKPAIYSGAVALVFPSLYEGFGLPVLEALACGTPAVVCTGSSLEEVAGEGALYAPPQDQLALQNAILRISQQTSLRDQLGQSGKAHARRFSWDMSARKTLEVYRTAFAQSSGVTR
ncbi:MAG: glycosyltransferase family 4 protein [Anaerolineae bacterium]